jgi:diguanylate cyclase (GGDEF)-like protein
MKLEQANNTINEQRKKMAKLRVDAKMDFLTKLANRHAFNESLIEEFERAKRYGSTFSLSMIDIDSFKKVNDRFGHIAGDKTLQVIAKLLLDQTRVNDSVCRFGGEEFSILLPQASIDKAIIVMEKIRQKVQAKSIIHDGNKIKITISIGVGEIDLSSETKENLIKRVDAALYQAKKSGKNLVIASKINQPTIGR